MKASIKNCCSALILCQLLLGANQVWSSDKKKREKPEQEQKVYAKKTKVSQEELNKLKKIESSLAELSQRIVGFDVNLREKDFKNLVLSVRTQLDEHLIELEKSNAPIEEKKKIKQTITAADEALNTMIHIWGMRQAKLEEAREKALEAEAADWIYTGTGPRPAGADVIPPSYLALT